MACFKTRVGFVNDIEAAFSAYYLAGENSEAVTPESESSEAVTPEVEGSLTDPKIFAGTPFTIEQDPDGRPVIVIQQDRGDLKKGLRIDADASEELLGDRYPVEGEAPLEAPVEIVPPAPVEGESAREAPEEIVPPKDAYQEEVLEKHGLTLMRYLQGEGLTSASSDADVEKAISKWSSDNQVALPYDQLELSYVL